MGVAHQKINVERSREMRYFQPFETAKRERGFLCNSAGKFSKLRYPSP